MAVSGKKSFCEKGSEEFIEITCKPCDDDGKYTAASGLCRECEENMCNTCFGHHRKGKFCKDHVLIDCAKMTGVMDNKADEGLEKCPQHLNEQIKFYCPDHDQVGCGDCMILEHKLCKVEYIPKKATEFRNSPDLDKLVKDIIDCDTQIQQCLSSVQTKRSQAEEMHVNFIAEAEAFKTDILKHVNKLTNELCSEAAAMRTHNIHSVDELEKDATGMAQEILLINKTFETQRNQPNKLFVTAVQFKEKVKVFRQLMEEIRNKDTIQEYMFQRDSQLENAVTTCSVLGLLQRIHGDEDGKDTKNESSLSQSRKKTKVTTDDVPKSQLLIDRKLRAENIDVDGDTLSFSSFNETGVENGLYIDSIIMKSGSYFEVEIIECGGSEASVGIGLVPKDYQSMTFPGWRRSSAGFHSDDGRVFIESDLGEPFGLPCGENDRMGCGISKKGIASVHVFFTRNGKRIGEKSFLTTRSLFPAVALDTYGQKVKVILDAQMPNV